MNNLEQNYLFTSIFTDRFFQFLVFILLFIALLYEQKNLILIAILILVMFYTAKFWSQLSIRNIHYSFDAEKKKGFPGESIALQATVSNDKILPIWLKLKIPIDNKLLPSSHLENHCLCEEFSLLWYDHSLWQWKLTAKHRGCFQIGPPSLETGDLLGFFQQTKYLSQSVEMIIYPKLISLNFISSPLKELFGKSGLNSPVKDPIYPVATQDYCHGDPAKYIHWKASARHNRLQSKVFDPSSQRKTLFIIDVSSFPKKDNRETFERILEVVAAMIMEFTRQGSPYGILSNGKMVGDEGASLSIANGPEQLSIAMELLARLTQKATHSMQQILFKKDMLQGGTGCIYCAYRLNKKNIQTSEFLKQHNIPAYFIVAKPSRYTNCSHSVFLLNEIRGEFLYSNEKQT